MAQVCKEARVVVVDDESNLAYMFAQYLGQSFKVEWFTSSLAALDHLRRQPSDLLVTDLVMPKLDGLQLTGLAKIQQPELRVIMVSGLNPWTWSQGESPNLALLDAYLAKPLPLGDLERCCGLMLQGRARRASKLEPWLYAALAC
jgi:two-component system cell cycle response regulator CpdR